MQFITQSLWLRSLGWALLNNFWQMSLLWLIYLLITVMNNRISARARHNGALILLHLGFFWFVFTLFRHLLGADIDDLLTVSLSGMMGNGAVVFFQFLKKSVIAFLPYLSAIYLFTLLGIFIRYTANYFHLIHLRTVGLQKIHPELRVFTSQISRRLGIKKKIGVWLSEHVSSPLTIGFLKPLILIPIATVNHLSMEQVETILLHELAHIRRNDFLTNLFVSIYGVLFFFNPFTRLFIHTIKKEREHCCDDLVIQFQYHPHTYASALLSLERSRARQNKLALAAVGKNNRLLLERIKRITGHAVFSSRYQFILPSFCILVLFAAASILVQPIQHAPKTIAVIPARYATDKELMNTQFVLNKPAIKEIKRSRKAIKSKQSRGNQQWPENTNVNIDLVQVNNQVPDNQEEDQPATNALATIQPEKNEYSFRVSPTPSLSLAQGNYGYPYVPNLSFSYSPDNNSDLGAEKSIQDEMLSDESTAKVLEAVKQIDWKKIEMLAAEGRCNITSSDIRNIQNQVKKCIRKADWFKINKQVDAMSTETDEKRIRQDIVLQLKSLKTLQNNLEIIQFQSDPGADHLKEQPNIKDIPSNDRITHPVRKRILMVVHI